MSMSDCPKCWCTPCDCGFQWSKYPEKYLRKMLRGITLELAERGSWYADTRQQLTGEKVASVAPDAAKRNVPLGHIDGIG